MGLNFYGYDFTRHLKTDDINAEAVVADKFLSGLAKHQPSLQWSEEWQENFIKYKVSQVSEDDVVVDWFWAVCGLAGSWHLIAGWLL